MDLSAGLFRYVGFILGILYLMLRWGLELIMELTWGSYKEGKATNFYFYSGV